MFEETSDIVLDTQTPVSKWAPIVYGRTYAVDFRFLVIPDNFDDNLKDLLWQYIKVTTREAENLSRNPRWIFIRDRKRCVVGVTCMVRDLIGSQAGNTPEDLTRDKLGRPLYTFVGYVSQDSMITVIPAMNLELFAEPYKEFVPKKWQEIYAELGSNQAAPQELKSRYEREFTLEAATEDLEAKKISIEKLLPSSQNSIIFWNISNAKNIWFTASKNKETLSICFGDFNKRDLIFSKFQNAVINEVEFRQEETKLQNISPRKPSSQSPEQQVSRQNINHRSNQSTKRNIPSQKAEHDISRLGNKVFSLYTETATTLSQFMRGGIELIIGEDEIRKIDELIINNLAPVARLFLPNEIVDEMCSRVAKIDEWAQRLNAAKQDYITQLHQLEKEIKELLKQDRKAEADVKLEEKRLIIEKINYLDKLNKDLIKIINSISRKQGSSTQQRRLEQASKEVQQDINFGFKEKEQTVDNEDRDRGKNIENTPPPKSKDLWDL
jgi:acyl carrier protein phosphodiesterase